MLGADGEVHVHPSVASAGIECALHEVLLQRGARAPRVVVEQQEALWQLAIGEALGAEQIVDDGLVLPGLHQLVDAPSLAVDEGGVQLLRESKVVDVGKELLDERCRGLVSHVILNRCFYLYELLGECKLIDEFSLQHVGHVDARHVVVLSFVVAGHGDALSGRCGCAQAQERESGLETL